MKQTKFRVWDKRNKVMLGEVQVWDWCEDKIIAEDGSDALEPISNFEIMQFTGLHDKNGKEIYEGDILEHYSALVPRGANPRIRLVAKWDGKNACFTNCFHAQEIIGNIYENPELLQQHGGRNDRRRDR